MELDEENNLRTSFDRVLRPGQEEVFYHYCCAATWLSILESDALRFSDINMMNDPHEWRYCYELFENAAGSLLSREETKALEGLNVDFFDLIDGYLSPKQLHSHPVIACFSKKPDVLSQWRGYADDGRGWAIGFKAEALGAMPVTLLEVEYDRSKQLDEVANYLAGLYVIWKERGGSFSEAVGTEATLFTSFLHGYKHPSFAEEQEVRALHELKVSLGENCWKLLDEVDGLPDQAAKFRASGPSVIAYVDIPLARAGGVSISEVWLGPSNDNGLGNVLFPLGAQGHENVRVFHSASSYRT